MPLDDFFHSMCYCGVQVYQYEVLSGDYPNPNREISDDYKGNCIELSRFSGTVHFLVNYDARNRENPEIPCALHSQKYLDMTVKLMKALLLGAYGRTNKSLEECGIANLENDIKKVGVIAKCLIRASLKKILPDFPFTAIRRIVYHLNVSEIKFVEDFENEDHIHLMKKLFALHKILYNILVMDFNVPKLVKLDKKGRVTNCDMKPLNDIKKSIREFPKFWEEFQDLIKRSMDISG